MDQEAFYKSESCLKHHLANCSVSCQFPRRDSEKGFRAWDVQRQSPKGMGGAGNREGEMLSRLWLRTMSARNLRSINHTPFEAKRWHLVFPVNQTWAVGHHFLGEEVSISQGHSSREGGFCEPSTAFKHRALTRQGDLGRAVTPFLSYTEQVFNKYLSSIDSYWSNR